MKILRVTPDERGKFISRNNRFLGIVQIKKGKEEVHIHDPGHLEELLYPGNEVLIKRAAGKKRKTKWDLIAAKYNEMWVFTNSAYHRKISEIILKNVLKEYKIRAEVKLGKSRIDFMAEGPEKIAIEVKGCTLTKNGIALFPDAPTERGRRHVEELNEFIKLGNRAILLVLVFRPDSKCFKPNEETDEKFSYTFWKAVDNGLEVMPALLKYDGKDIEYLRDLPLCTF